MSLEVHHSYSTNDTLVGFQQEPNGRGTLSILFSCLLTLSLCVWSATHLDLPRQAESKQHYTLRYLKWSLLGMFGPELLIWVAWRQYVSARVLTKSVQELARSEKIATAAQQWTMVHSFYAGMGGLVFDLTEPDIVEDTPIIPDLQRLHITARGAQLLAQCDLLPNITKEQINDKSKADASGKLICCVQVAWVLVSAVNRVAVGLPVTPLEVNTIAHVICALIVYILWWSKPRWVNEPTTLRGTWTRPMCAFMYMSSQVSAARRNERDLLRNFGVKTELAGVMYTSSATEMPQGRAPRGIIVPRSERGTLNLNNKDPEHIALNAMREVRWKNCCEALQQYPAIWQRMKLPERSADQLRYREALQLYPEMPPSIKRRFLGHNQEDEPATTSQTEGWVFMSEELVVDHPRNWPGDELIRHVQGHLMGMIMWCTSTVYGAVHLAGWNEHFPTIIELWFWRASALYVVFSGLLWSFLNLLGHVSGPVWIFWYDFLAHDVRTSSRTLIYVLAFVGGSLYFIARTFLVVEAFISLRALPASAYASPSWVLTVPHIG